MAAIRTEPAVTNGVAADTPFSAVRSRLLAALIFELLAVVVDVIGVFVLIGATIAMATEDNFSGATLFFGYLADLLPAAFLATGAVLSTMLVVRAWQMLGAAGHGDVAALRRRGSLGWVAIGYVFSWIVPGALLHRANRLIGSMGE